MSDMETRPQIVLALPAHGPHGPWLERVRLLAELLAHYGTVHISICPDGSYGAYSQETLQGLADLNKHYPVAVYDYTPNQGKGHAVRHAVAQAGPAEQLFLYTDYDVPFSLPSYQRLIETLLAGANVVVGNRGSHYVSHLSPFRKVLSLGSHLLNRVLFGLPVSDTQGGIKAFDAKGREALLATNINSYLFDTQFIAIATRRKLLLEEVPVTLRSEGIKFSKMGLRILLRELRAVLQVLKSRWF